MSHTDEQPIDTSELLKMSELARLAGVSATTIRYYLRLGLLGEEGSDYVRTGRNMAYYQPHVVDRVILVKRLQEERFMPLKVIGELLERDPDSAERLMELEDRIAARVGDIRDVRWVDRDTVLETYDVPAIALDRLAEIDVLSPDDQGRYDQDDIEIIEAIAHFRAGGYEQTLGFTVYDTLRYKEALSPLVAEEVNVLLGRLAGTVDVDRAVEIAGSGVEPLRELIGAMHSKLLAAELRRRRKQPFPG